MSRSTVLGSSPRMRGTPHLCRDAAFGHGIIPAYAGNTLCSICRRSCWKDHPRVCGEHLAVERLALVDAGSSPRMRGTLCDGRSEIVQPGIIPAYAGNTNRVRLDGIRPRDHPRVCGEHRGGLTVLSEREGSSPRMRGTLVIGRVACVVLGIIPAYAGNTMAVEPCHALVWDHPRVCGEHVVNCSPPHAASGSSPRMRGTPENRRRHNIQIQDHPRVCGEHEAAVTGGLTDAGSSPRMRGTLSIRPSSMWRRGIIPAYAGNTISTAPQSTVCWDHPRVCGEHLTL